MKIFVKTLKGTHFEIEVNLDDTIVDVKKKIESLHGQDVYPAAHQILIHEGKILKYGTTLEENNVSENSFIMIMLSKVAEKTTAPPPPATVTPPIVNASSENNLEASIQQILEMGGGIWDRYTVFHALRAAYNNPEIAVEYLCSGIPESAGPHANPLNVLPQKPEVYVIQLLDFIWLPDLEQLLVCPTSGNQMDDVAELLFSRPGNWSITLEQHFAIERLIGMGFDKSAVIDVFFACEKNEEMTANYLLDHMHDFQ